MRQVARGLLLMVVGAAGCGDGGQVNQGTGNGGGGGLELGKLGGGSGSGGSSGGGSGCGQLVATLRDFRADHPDFEKTIRDDLGLVQANLGSDKKPVFAP